MRLWVAVVAPAQVRPTLISFHPPERNACLVWKANFSRGPPIRGKVCRGVGDSGWSHLCSGTANHHQNQSSPGTQICLAPTPLGVATYGVWGPVLQAPAQGCPTIAGGLPASLTRGRTPTSPRGRNYCPSLPTIPISPILCTRPRGDGVGSATASTLSLVPYSVIHPSSSHPP